MRNTTERLKGHAANHPELIAARTYGEADYAVNQIVRGRVAGVFVIIGKGVFTDGTRGVYLKAVNPDNLTETSPGQIFLGYGDIRPYNPPEEPLPEVELEYPLQKITKVSLRGNTYAVLWNNRDDFENQVRVPARVFAKLSDYVRGRDASPWYTSWAGGMEHIECTRPYPGEPEIIRVRYYYGHPGSPLQANVVRVDMDAARLFDCMLAGWWV